MCPAITFVILSISFLTSNNSSLVGSGYDTLIFLVHFHVLVFPSETTYIPNSIDGTILPDIGVNSIDNGDYSYHFTTSW